MSEMNDSQRQAIIEAIEAGRKIEAIKLYREATGLGLKESKEFIDQLTVQLIDEDPERFERAKQNSGCAAIILIALTSISIGATIGQRFL